MVEDHEHLSFGEVIGPEPLDEGADGAGVVGERCIA